MERVKGLCWFIVEGANELNVDKEVKDRAWQILLSEGINDFALCEIIASAIDDGDKKRAFEELSKQEEIHFSALCKLLQNENVSNEYKLPLWKKVSENPNISIRLLRKALSNAPKDFQTPATDLLMKKLTSTEKKEED